MADPFSGTFKLTALIDDTEQGFSETVYFQSSPTMAAAKVVGLRYCQYRAPLLGRTLSSVTVGGNYVFSSHGQGSPRIKAIRIVDAYNPRHGQVFRFDQTEYLGTGRYPSGMTAPVTTAADYRTVSHYSGSDRLTTTLYYKMRGRTNDAYNSPITSVQLEGRRAFQLRGIPDGLTSLALLSSIVGFTADWGAFKSVLLSPSTLFGMLVRSKTPPWHNRTVIGFEFIGNQAAILLSTAGAQAPNLLNNGTEGILDGDKIRLYGCNVKDWNGSYYVNLVPPVSPATTSNKLLLVGGPGPNTPLPTLGFMRGLKLTGAGGSRPKHFARFIKAEEVRVSTMPAGGPFALSASRRSGKKRSRKAWGSPLVVAS